jgi:hypothetical protein
LGTDENGLKFLAVVVARNSRILHPSIKDAESGHEVKFLRLPGPGWGANPGSYDFVYFLIPSVTALSTLKLFKMEDRLGPHLRYF